MTFAVQCMKLDYLLLKPYLKSVLLVLLVPLIFPFFTGTLFEGLSFAATVMAMTTGYAFSVVEKNGFDRFYGFLPVKKSALVVGRYLIIYVMGFSALLISSCVQSAILHLQHAAPSPAEMMGTILVCLLLFCLYAGVQIPGYYRYGSIKGKMFMFVPTVGFLLFYYVMGSFVGETNRMDLLIMQNSALAYLCGIGLVALVLVVSAAASIKIVQKNRV